MKLTPARIPDPPMIVNHHSIRNRLLRFLAISVALHLYLLVEFRYSSSLAPTRFLGQPVLNIQLQDYTPSPAPVSYLKTATASPTTKRARRNFAAPVEVIADTSAADSSADSGTHTAMPANEARQESLRNQLLGELKTRLSHYLNYPTLARRQGWEGTVLLGLRVESDGQLDRIRLERSSGYAVLDNSALNSLKQVGHLVEARTWLEGRSVDMQLPVIYRLIEN